MEQGEILIWSGKCRGLGLLIPLILCIIIINTSSIIKVSASIHEYKNEAFTPKTNAFFFHGGSEGLYASKVHDSAAAASSDQPLRGRSFIRYSPLSSLFN